MATKKCAVPECEVMFEAKAARKFCDLHAGAKKLKGDRKSKPEPADSDEGMAYPISLTERQLDRFWANLTLVDKGQAVQAILDWQELT